MIGRAEILSWRSQPLKGGCATPIRVGNRREGVELLVECGSCIPCLRLKQGRLAGRIMAQNFIDGGTFITLTLSDDYLSDEQMDPSWWRYEKQKLLQRVQDKLDLAVRPHYSLTAEIGEQTARQHGHMTLHGVVLPPQPYMREKWLWKYGHVRVEPLTTTRASYIANYMKSEVKSDLHIVSSRSQLLGESFFVDDLDARALRAASGDGSAFLDGSCTDVPVPRHRLLPNEFVGKKYPLDRKFLRIAQSNGLLAPYSRAHAELLAELNRSGLDHELNAHGSTWGVLVAGENRLAEYARRKIASDAQALKPQIQLSSGGVHVLNF